MDVGDYEFTLNYFTDGNYKSNSTVIHVNVGEIETEFDAHIKAVNSTVVIDVYLPENATGNLTVKVNGEPRTVPADKQINLTDLAPGDYTIEVSYDGDGRYTPSSNTVVQEVTIPKITNYTILIEVRDIVYGENATITIILPDDVVANVNITVNNKSQSVRSVDGVSSINVTGLNATTYTVYVVYEGDDNYARSSNATDFNVAKANVTIETEYEETIKVGSDLVVTVRINATGTIIINTGSRDFTGELDEGVAVITLTDLADGTYDIPLRYLGDDNHNANETIISFTVVNKEVADINISCDENGVLNITISNDITETVNITIDGVEATYNVVDGQIIDELPILTVGSCG